MVLLAPVVMFLVMCVLFLGHRADTNLKIQHAADVAARIASMHSTDKMQEAGAVAASDDLQLQNQDCSEVSTHMSLGTFGVLRTVTVTVNCREQRRDALWLGIRPRQVSASSTEVIDAYSFR
jgi:hypothetical protein